MSYLDLSVKEMHEALVTKKVTPLELTKEALARAHENKDNAFEFIDDEGAIKFASSLIEPEEDNVFWGIPYVAKDNFSELAFVTGLEMDYSMTKGVVHVRMVVSAI